MKFRMFGLAVASLAAVSLMATPASAAQFIKVDGPVGSFTSFTLKVDDLPNAIDGYDVLGIEAGGLFSNKSVTGLVPNTHQPFANIFNGVFFDNDYFTIDASNPTHFDSAGIIISLASSINPLWAHIYGDSGAMHVQSMVSTPAGFFVSDSSPVALTFTKVSEAVPEPAGWALMLLGFGGVGALLRRRRLLLAR